MDPTIGRRILLWARPGSIDVVPELNEAVTYAIPPGSGEPPTIRNLLPEGLHEGDALRDLAPGRDVATIHITSLGQCDSIIEPMLRETGDEPIIVYVVSDVALDAAQAVARAFEDVTQSVYVVERVEE